MRILTLSLTFVAALVLCLAACGPSNVTQAPGAGTVPGANEPFASRVVPTVVDAPGGTVPGGVIPTSNPSGAFTNNPPTSVTEARGTPSGSPASDNGANGPRGVNTTNGVNTGNAASPVPGLGTGPSAGQSPAVSVQMMQQNNSGETGGAMLTDIGGGRTRVDLTVDNGTASQPAHIHDGTCANLDPTPHFPLNNVQNGTSTTEIPVALSDLTNGRFAINVHKSDAEIDVYVACGDIPAR